MKNIELSVIIPYTYGEELREKALKKVLDCISVQTFKNFELILVEQLIKTYDHDSPSFGIYTDTMSRIKLIDPKGRKFNKSWCINVAADIAKSDKLIIIDADMLFGKDYFEKIMRYSKVCPNFFSGYNWITCLPGPDNPVTRVREYNSVAATGGAWFINRKIFDIVGRMNENYFGYGGEDNDMWERVKHVLNHMPGIAYPLTHQYHHWHQKTGVNPLNEERLHIFRKTQTKVERVIEILSNSHSGNPHMPTTTDWKKI